MKAGKISRQQFAIWVHEALIKLNGRAKIIDVSKYIWGTYESDIRMYEETFYKWQYEIRWSAKLLRETGIIKPVSESPRGIWELSESDRH